MVKKILIFLLCIIITVIAFAGYVYIDNNTVSLSKYTIYSPKLPTAFKGYKIALIADFHNSYYFDKVAKQVKKASPDIILLAGDMIDVTVNSFSNTYKLLDLLKEIAPVYSVQGNHEIWHKLREEYQSNINEMGIKTLDNEETELKKDEAIIKLYGLKDILESDSKIEGSSDLKYTIELAKDELNPDMFSILLMHRANYFDYLKDCHYDLVLSGHIHGGLIRLPFIGGLVSSDNIWFPKYTSGIYTYKNSKMVVSRGMDYNPKKMRVFNGPEVVLITLDK